MKASFCLLVVVVVACSDRRAVRIVAGRSDTVIVNSREAVPLDLRLVNASGDTRPAKHAHVTQASEGVVELAANGKVKCNGAGDAELSATQDELSTSFTVLCRPIAAFRLPRVIRLTPDGPPVPLELGAVGTNGEAIEIVAGKLFVIDTQVAMVVDGQVYPRARGSTAIDVEAGDCVVTIPVEVVDASPDATTILPHQYYAESLSVAAGELRSWHLPTGRYDISLVDDNGAPEYLTLASYEMNCAAIPRTDQHYSCVAKDRASVIVHHTRPAGRGREARAVLLIKRKSDSIRDPAWRHRLYVYTCPFIG